MKGIADTGFLVAFANRQDQHHAWALGIAGQLTGPLLTGDAVLAEVAFNLHSVEIALSLMREGMVTPVFSIANNRARLEALAGRYRDRKPDLADLCLIRLSEMYPRHPVITTDVRDFQIYRRGRRERIPLICPPS